MILPFNIEFQTQSNWCWAATAKSVSRFYSQLSSWTQCKIATAELNYQCCHGTLPYECNEQWYLDRALARTNNYVQITGIISWEDVLAELQKGLVVGARVGWFDGGGHFMVIHGATKNGEVKYLHIDDPIYGKSDLPYSQFVNNYRRSGRWTHTYHTKKHNSDMWFKAVRINKRLVKPILDLESAISSKASSAENSLNNPLLTNELDLPHFAFFLGLNEVKNNQKWPDKPSSYRVIDLVNQSPVKLYEVSADEETPELIQISTNRLYFDEMVKSMELLRNSTIDVEQGEIRLLKIPALNAEAIWLYFDDRGEKDMIAPIKLFSADSRFSWNKPYKIVEFSAILKTLAESINDSDELLGG